jgi:methylglutaconyl-CoA hydratase
MSLETIKISKNFGVCEIRLNRPEVRNAINSIMIKELTEVFESLVDDVETRIIVITGEGKSFCAGADLNWLKSIADFTFNDNYYESLDLVNLLYLIHDHPKPIISKINGSAVGGGVGIMLVSDIIIANTEAKFGLSEVSIGIVPVAIAPFVMRRIGETKAREYFLTGERINSQTAHEIGLINHVVDANEIDEFTQKKINVLLKNGPKALANVKDLMNRINKGAYDKDFLAQLIAQLRTSDEGQEGMHAFLEKRSPKWRKEYHEN